MPTHNISIFEGFLRIFIASVTICAFSGIFYTCHQFMIWIGASDPILEMIFTIAIYTSLFLGLAFFIVFSTAHIMLNVLKR